MRDNSWLCQILFIMLDNFIVNNTSFYFIGIGGVSMSALAKFLHYQGKRVSGEDINENEYTDELRSMGIVVNGAPLNGFEVVVYTDAIKENDVTLCEARKQNKLIVSRVQLLNAVCELFNKSIAIAGCHGKTTCTSMLSHIYLSAEESFSCHIGGRDIVLKNCFCHGFGTFITEACEYKKNFLNLKPDIAVVLNSCPDHLECYGSASELKECYSTFLKNSKNSVCLFGDIESDSITFGFDDRADYYAKAIKNVSGKFTFNVFERGNLLGKVILSVYGKHNVLNALACVAVARMQGISFECIKNGLQDFKGVERRFETIGNVNGAKCIADYAHHPDEIRATVKAAKIITQGELFVVFQPHTYSRTKNLFKDFVRVLSQLKNVLIFKTYPAREYFDDAGSALTLSQSIKKSHYAESVWDINRFLLKAKEGDTILFLGAGDIYYLAKRLVDKP